MKLEQLEKERKIKELKKKIGLFQKMIDIIRKIIGFQTELERLQIKKIIVKTANQYKVDSNLALRVAQCESNFNPKATNKKGNNPTWSVDRGLYMWNDYWHSEISDKCAFDPECATKKFCEAVKNGNLHWWNPSKKCWG